MDFYDRQKALGLNIKQSLTIAGCGGIGYWVAKYAAMSGIENLCLFDPDVLEVSNLNRIDLPLSFIGKNKAEVTYLVVKELRPECRIISMPFKLQEHTFQKTDWLVDCTDNIKSQVEHEKIAKKFGSIYVKAGYDGEQMSIHNGVGEWGEAPDGYVTIPSWVVPASMVAALTVAKILKYKGSELATDVKNLFGFRR